jgi:transcriptional regulator with XRE-family HTH domain
MAKKTTKSDVPLSSRIKAMRESRKLDLETLAQKAGLTADFLAEIEEGKISPPVGALISISRALAVDSSTLLAEERKKERQEGYEKRTQAYSYQSLTPDAQDKHLWAYLITLDPKKDHEMVAYKHEGEEFVYVLEGEVELKVGDDLVHLSGSESFHFNSSLSHHLKNLSDSQSKLLVIVYTP